jgi:hypothetical protein
MDERIKTVVQSNIPILKDLAQRFSSYQVAPVNLENIMYFLTQFDTAEEVSVIIKMLRHIDFLNHGKMKQLLKNSYEALDEDITTNPLIAPLGSIQDSSAVICYSLLKDLFSSESTSLERITEVNRIGERLAIQRPSALIFFDDNITSGTQLADFFDELITGKEKPELVAKPLSDQEFKLLQQTPIRICYAIQLSKAADRKVDEIRRKYSLNIEISCGRHDYDNYILYGARVIDSPEEAAFTDGFLRRIATPLYDDKNWVKEKLYHRLLGYGNLGKLTVFYYNVPKSFVPVFWKYGKYSGKPWIPLFPETQEQKKLVADKIEFDYFKKQTIKSWINTPLEELRQPRFEIGFITETGITDEFVILVPSRASIHEWVTKRVSPQPLPYQANRINSRMVDMNDVAAYIQQSFAAGQSGLTEEQYDSYLKAIDRYNYALNEFAETARTYIKRVITRQSVTLVLSNNGDKVAHGVLLKLIYDSGEVLINGFEGLEKPTFKLEKPLLDHYTPGIARVVRTENDYLGDLRRLTGQVPAEPVQLGKTYSCKFEHPRIGHNNYVDIKLDIIQINNAADESTISYELNYDEEGRTIRGELKIRYEEVDEISSELETLMANQVKVFMSELINSPYVR